MNAPLRVNEALLIAGHAFQPFQCVAWAPEANGELTLAVVDRTNQRIGQALLPSSTYSDARQLAQRLEEVRSELQQEGYSLQAWHMPR